ncbi:MAG: head GIN domain-containing protein [Aequorivita antarctica]
MSNNINIEFCKRTLKLFRTVFFLGSFSAAVLFLFAGCDSDSGWDCTQKAGNIVETEFTVQPFTKILVWERIKLFVKQGNEQKVVVETGENLMSDIEVSVTDGKLEIHNNNGCNLVRDYGLTKVYITSPNITEIRSSTGLAVESIGVLRYPSLTLLSEDQLNEDEYHTDGDFKMELEVQSLNIVANGLSKFYLSGTANSASFGLYASDCRIYSEDLIVQNLYVFHRSTGDIVVNPQQKIRGKIVSLGNVISKTRPPVVEVEELYRGKLIFE